MIHLIKMSNKNTRISHKKRKDHFRVALSPESVLTGFITVSDDAAASTKRRRVCEHSRNRDILHIARHFNRHCRHHVAFTVHFSQRKSVIFGGAIPCATFRTDSLRKLSWEPRNAREIEIEARFQIRQLEFVMRIRCSLHCFS